MKAARHHTLLTILTLSIITTLLPLTAIAPAQADTTHTFLKVTLLGDSYSAGNGAGNYEPENAGDPRGNAYRSRNNWAHHYVNWLNSQGVHTSLTNVAHSGDITDNVTQSQIKAMPADTDLAMLTIGGNDVDFADIVSQCFVVGTRNAKACQNKVEAAQGKLSTVKTRTVEILQDIDEKLDDDAEVVLVGYPRLATDRDYILTQTDGNRVNPNVIKYDAGTEVRNLSDQAKEVQSSLVKD